MSSWATLTSTDRREPERADAILNPREIQRNEPVLPDLGEPPASGGRCAGVSRAGSLEGFAVRLCGHGLTTRGGRPPGGPRTMMLRGVLTGAPMDLGRAPWAAETSRRPVRQERRVLRPFGGQEVRRCARSGDHG